MTSENKSFFTPSDPIPNYKEAIGNPGEFPFTRGIHPSMYRSKLWTMRQYAGYGSAKETNERFKRLLKQGQMGLSVAFDLPTQMGYDPDDPKALGEVGRVGVNIASLEDLETLFDGIPLENVSTSMTINATAPILLALYIALGKRRGIKQEALAGTLQNDVLKEYIARGTYIYPLAFSMKLALDILEYCATSMPKMNPISISGYHMREAGATAVQEIAFTFANAIEYLEQAQKRKLPIDELGNKISFFFACHNNFFEEIAKFRAARRLWAELMKTKFKATDPKAMMLRFHTQTAGSTLTGQQPLNNVVRIALQAFAAVMGGTQSLHTNAYDEALALPTEHSAILALRTQQIIAHETKATQPADPFGGSYYLECLTEELYEKAKELLNEALNQGGALACIQSGYFERAINQSAYEAQQALETNKTITVGVNEFVTDENEPTTTLKIDPNIETLAVERIRSLKATRSSKEASRLLDQIKQSASKNENLIPHFTNAVIAGVTLGEISRALRELFGEYDSGTFGAEEQS